MEGIGQRFVYILRSERDPARHYVGRTADQCVPAFAGVSLEAV